MIVPFEPPLERKPGTALSVPVWLALATGVWLTTAYAEPGAEASTGLAAAVASENANASQCDEVIDRSAALIDDDDLATVEAELQSLDTPCSEHPAIHHNRGVIALQRADAAGALHHFESAVTSDPHTAESFAALRAVAGFRARMAYADALGHAGDDTLPTVAPQRARHVSNLHSESTLANALFDWWRSARADDPLDWQQQYSDGYPVPERRRLASIDWSELDAEIALTRHDGVIVIRHPFQSLLLLRPEGNRWRIYQETDL